MPIKVRIAQCPFKKLGHKLLDEYFLLVLICLPYQLMIGVNIIQQCLGV